MAYTPRFMREEQNLRSQRERGEVALKQSRTMVEVPFEWQTKQTAQAVLFPTYGWVPKIAIRWRRSTDSKIIMWEDGIPGRGDTFLLSKEFAEGVCK